MSEPEEIQKDADFDEQMRGLFEEAEQHVLERRSGGNAKSSEASVDGVATAQEKGAGETPRPPAPRSYPNLPQMLRPLVLGLEAMTRATGENTSLLTKLDRAADATAEAQNDLPHLIAELRSLLELKNTMNQRMFDALHEELKDYKDDFLLESVHRPVIRDLISLYDDLAEIHRQISGAIAESDGDECAPCTRALVDRMKTLTMNVEHKLDFIVEVLARLEVTPLLGGTGKLDKLTQRVIALEPAQSADEDGDIVRSVKRGFLWKERVVRAEEVVVKKWKDSSAQYAISPPEK